MHQQPAPLRAVTAGRPARGAEIRWRALWPLLCALTVVEVCATGWAASSTTPQARMALGVTTCLLVGTAGSAIVLRARSVDVQHGLWRRASVAACLGVAGTALGAALAGHGDGAMGVAAAVAFTVLWAVFFVPAYGALVRWNRYPTAVADPHDMINGVSSVLAALALLDLVLRSWWAPAAVTPWWSLLTREVPAVVLLVCLGTAASLPAIAGLGRQRSYWLTVTGLALGLAASWLWLLAGAGTVWAGCLVALAAGCTAAAAFVHDEPVVAVPADPVAATHGAFGVLVTSVVLLVVGLHLEVASPALFAAGAAAVGAGIRLRINARDLAHLAVTRRQALTDELTGLANRRSLLEALDGSSSRPRVLALLDLDRFKEVNDGLGHGAGDDLIQLVARRLQAHVPSPVVLARLGGDEFAVVVDVVPDEPAAVQAQALGERIATALAAPFNLGAMSVHVSASAGVATTAGEGAGPPAGGRPGATELLRRADAAMYEAKRSRSSFAVYDRASHDRAAGELALVEDLRRALVNGSLLLHHQPQVSTSTGAVTGVEALVRWQHPERGLLPPAVFLPSAEAHGLMGVLSEVVLEQAVTQLAAWHAQGLRMRMSVNLSASNLLDSTLPARVAQLLHHHSLPPAVLVLEVTETVLISDPERSLAVMHDLAALGVGLSIDDYGTGYSSLAYLRRLPVHELKLDRSFTTDLLVDQRARAVVASTVELAHALGLRVVAEGVEDDATLAHLAAIGCDETQGYLHSKPLPAAELTSWMAALRFPGDTSALVFSDAGVVPKQQ